MFWEGLCLDRGVGPSNLGVHLEVNHRGWNWWWGHAAILHGQECKRHGEVGTKVIGTSIGTQWGSFVRTHVTVSLSVCVRRAEFVVC